MFKTNRHSKSNLVETEAQQQTQKVKKYFWDSLDLLTFQLEQFVLKHSATNKNILKPDSDRMLKLGVNNNCIYNSFIRVQGPVLENKTNRTNSFEGPGPIL